MRASVPRVAAAVAIQVAILALVPARQVQARLRGQLVTLETGPIDPFSPFAGHHVALWYRVESDADDRGPASLESGDLVYLNVARAEPGWRFVSVTREPLPPGPDRASLRARWTRYGRPEIEGARRLYVPEEKAKAVTDAISAQRRRAFEEHEAARRSGVELPGERPWERAYGLVDLRVDQDGSTALVRLRVLDVVAEW